MRTEETAPHTRVCVLPAEWRWVLGWTVAILLFSSAPYLLGWAKAAGGEMTFSGFVIGVEDGNSYLAKMAQGARGHWLFHIVHTSELHEGVFVYLFHLLLGKVAALLPGPAAQLPLRLIWVYHAARLVCSTALLLVIYRFVAEFLPERPWRRLAWLLVSLGGGLGWLLLVLGQGGDWLGSPPLDFILPEGFTFLVIFSLPHIALARTLLLGGMLAWLRGMERLSFRPVAAAGFMWSVMAVIVPFYPLVAGVVVGVTLLLWWRQRALAPRKEIGWSLLAGLIASPMVLYSIWLFSTDPIMQGWSAQNLILSPHPFHYVAAYGLPALAALAGLRWIWRERPAAKFWLLLGWALVIPPLLYAPFNLQRRLIESYQLPLYILAVMGVRQLLGLRRPLRRSSLRRWSVLLLALVFPTMLMLVASSTLLVASEIEPIFHPAVEVRVAEWLIDHAEEGDLLVSDFPAGNFLPAWAPVRVYYGHGPETIDFETKKENILRFYAAETDDSWRRNFLSTHDVRFVLHGPTEQELGDFDPAGRVYLKQVFEQDEWTLYRVVP